MIGTSLSHYDLLEDAGRGGMGQVYRAFDRRLRRQVAIKILPTDESGSSVGSGSKGSGSREKERRRLLGEARAVALLNHPGIVSVFEVGHDRDIDFLVMEWVQGKTLGQVIEERSLTVRAAVEHAAAVAEAMAAAHANGVVHRDLKPKNVMIDEAGRIRVLDFGIARIEPLPDQETLSRTGESHDTSEAGTGASPGTYAYMSPEQVLGEEVDRATDVFSLGVVLYEMLTGRRPFAAKNLPNLVHRVVFDEPDPPSEIAAEIGSPLLAPISPEIDAIVLRALTKDPRERPAMATLAAELRGVAAAPEVLAPRGRSEPSQPRRRSRAARAAVVLLVGAALATIAALRPGCSVERGTEPASGAIGESDALPESPYVLYRQGLQFLERYDREGYIERAIEHFEAALASRAEYAPAYSGLARAYWRQYRRKSDPVWLHRAEVSAREALALDPQLSDPRVELARILVAKGELESAREQLDVLSRLDPDNPDVLYAEAQYASASGRPEEAASFYRKALEKRPGDWEILLLLGLLEVRLGDLDAAEAALLESIEQVPDNAFSHRNLAAIHHFRGRYDEAVQALQESISIQPSASAYSNLGTLYFFRGHYGDAASAFESARALGANDYQIWANLGDAYRQITGREDEARECFRRALQLLEATIGDDVPSAEVKSRRALYAAKLGNGEAAAADLAGLDPLYDQNGAACFRAAVAYELLDRREEALSALEIAYEKGYAADEIRNEPELVDLREDVRFHRIALRYEPGPRGPSARGDQPPD